MSDHMPNPAADDIHAYSFAAMGTSCALKLFAPSRVEADMAAAWAIAEVERIEKKYSRYAETSTLSQINRVAGDGGTVAVDEETAGLLDFAFACYAKSGGLFDITSGVLRRVWKFSSGRLPDAAAVVALLPLIGMEKLLWNSPSLAFGVPGVELDFGGLGKEYAVDRVAALLGAAGIKHGLIDLGGDFFALGPRPNGEAWRIGLRDPNDAGQILGEVAVSGGALATSGNYERCLEINGIRYSHILDPQTGWPVHGLSSVTVPRSTMHGCREHQHHCHAQGKRRYRVAGRNGSAP
jgi:thiamine biosynthesis lipoprotein